MAIHLSKLVLVFHSTKDEIKKAGTLFGFETFKRGVHKIRGHVLSHIGKASMHIIQETNCVVRDVA